MRMALIVFVYLNAWFPVCGTVWDRLEAIDLLEAVKPQSPHEAQSPPPSLSLGFIVCGSDGSSLLLLQHHACLLAPQHDDPGPTL